MGSLPKASGVRINKGRSFTQAQWKFIEQQMALLPHTSVNQRLRFALRFFYATGLRLAEGVAATVDHLNWASYPGAPDEAPVEGWELTVVGKGGKPRVVPLPLEAIGDLSKSFESRGLQPDPANPVSRGAFLLGRAGDLAERAPWLPQAGEPKNPKAGITAGTLYGQFKGFFGRCAAVLLPVDLQGAECLAAASTHWLRHTHGSHAVAAGMPLDVLQQNLGHASPTPRRYTRLQKSGGG